MRSVSRACRYWARSHEVERGQQHLATDEAGRLERAVVVAHEPALADGRDGLENGGVGRPGVEAQDR